MSVQLVSVLVAFQTVYHVTPSALIEIPSPLKCPENVGGRASASIVTIEVREFQRRVSDSCQIDRFNRLV